MDSEALSGGWFRSVWLQLAALSLLTACSVDNRPGYGVLLQIDTDLATPKDLDRVHVEVTQSGTTVLDQFFAIGSDDEPPPLEISIGYRGDPAPAQFKVVGSRSGQERVERLAITPIPGSRWSILRMRLQYLCVGQSAAAGGEGCDEGLTCVQGECQPATLAESDLPDYQAPEAVRTGSASSTGGIAGCFDVLNCFDSASEAQLETDCSFAINPAISSDQLNVALRLARGGAGTCGDSGCYIPFDRDGEGYTFEPGRVSLPAVVCERMQAPAEAEAVLGVIFSNGCAAKRGGVAVCYESSNADPTGGAIVTGVLPDPSVGPACGGGRIKSCGMCGTQARPCDDGNWGEFGACDAQGECAVDETRPCESDGVQTCGGDCLWGECLGQVCPGVGSQACERCGTQARGCDNGVWAEWDVCLGQGECMAGETQACGTNGTQACGGNCAWGACGEQVCPGAPSEACGMCGSHARTCDPASGQWSEFAACGGEGACMPNQTRACGSNGTQVCGGNCQWGAACTDQTCQGERSMGCGNCGTRTRTCDMNSGTWSDWSACTGEGACAPDQTRGCGRGGTQTCDGSCRWDNVCTGQSCVGANRQSCGNCGEQTRTCNGANGLWSDWSSCSEQGECRANSVRSCGTSGTQECGEDCAWEAECSGQTCAGEGSRACGDCGVQRRPCNASTGRYGDWGACENQGMCTPEATRGCGSQGTQSCGDNCQWGGVCAGQVCAEPASRPCGNCGTQTSTCDPNTGRANWSTCSGEGQCAPGSTQDCGSGGEQVCGMDCRWSSSCTMQVCAPPRPSPQQCGLCGTRTATCNANSGEWVFPTQCANERSCMPGQSRGCGTDSAGNEICGEGCEWGACRYTCTEPLTRPCGNCGTQMGRCDETTGKVIYEETCRNSGACRPGASESCRTAEGSGEHVCTDRCAWPEGCTLTSYDCDQPQGVSCGNCGTTGACDTSTGQRVCVEESGSCDVGTTQGCRTDAGRSGLQLCVMGCIWTQCQAMCEQGEGVSCGDRCGRTGTCDTNTGERACVNQGACVVGATQNCSTSEGTGTQECVGGCTWGTCQITSRVCTEPQGVGCGNRCGLTGDCNTTTGERECVVESGACVVGTTQDCSTSEGSGSQRCVGGCTWGTCEIDTRVCTQPEGVLCGDRCGRTGACDTRTGQRACVEADGACPLADRQNCSTSEGSGTQECVAGCTWGTCEITSRVCMQPEGVGCGNRCGRTGECNTSTGQRACVNEGACVVGATQDCSTTEGSGMQECVTGCTWGTCKISSRVCTQPEDAACGDRCGRTGECNTATGQRACTNEGVCVPGRTQDCSTSAGYGTQVCNGLCGWGDCQIAVRNCEQPADVPCGGCRRTGACNTTTGERECVLPEGACESGATDSSCATDTGGSGSRTCSACSWGTCQATCVGSANEPCGNLCGRTSASCDDSGQRACVERQGACQAGAVDNTCQVTVDGTVLIGVRVCSGDCIWGACEPIIIN